MNRIVSRLGVLSSIILFSSCSGGECLQGPLCEGGGSGGGGGATPVATSITLSPATLSFNAVGAAQQLTATVLDQSGSVISDATVVWASSSNGVATVSDGLVTAVGNGTALIQVTSGSATSSAGVTVAQEPTAVVVTPDTLGLVVGEAQILTASVRDRLGASIVAAAVTWSSDNPGVVTISGGGLATAVKAGVVVATAEYESIQGRSIISVGAPLSITTSALPGGLSGSVFAATLESAGGQVGTIWSIVSGSLPEGLSLDATSGTISGTPSGSGTFVFTVQALNGEQVATRALSITISDSLILTTASLANGVVGVSYSQALSAAGGDGVYAWSVTSGSLPDGLTLDGASGEISGSPSAQGTSTFVVRVESGGSSVSSQFVLEVVSPLSVVSGVTPNGVVGTEYGPATLAAAGGTGSYIWSLQDGSSPLPPGLSLATSGVITGTPTSAGSFDFVVRVESGTEVAFGGVSITISEGVAITTSTIADGVTGTAYSQGFSSAGGDGSGTWSIAEGALPAGLNLDPGTGVVSGIPTDAGSTTFTLQVTKGADSASRSFTLNVFEPLAIATVGLPEATVATPYSPQPLSASGGDGIYAWSVSAGSLPAGIALARDGVLSGTPVAAGSQEFTIRVASGQQIAEQSLAISVNEASFLLAANNITVMCSAASVGDTGVVNGVTYTKRDRAGIDALVAAGDYAPLATTCTSGITDMSSVFQDQDTFNEDVSSWDVSSVTDMSFMFTIARQFNQPIGSWDVSNVTNMIAMFDSNEAFNQDLSGWDVSGVTNMFGMFNGAIVFNQPLGSWDVSSVTDMRRMFNYAYAFDQDISAWDVSGGPSLDLMFASAYAFNQDISGWDVSNVTSMQRLFYDAAAFDQDISRWDVSGVTSMEQMFFFAVAFNQDISGWDVSSVTNMAGMFHGRAEQSTFNQDLSGWCVSNITTAPLDFDTDTPAWSSARPVWGTCSAASIESSSVTLNPSSLTSDGVSTSTISVQLRDGSGSKLTASAGTLTFDTPSLGSIGVVTDNLDGTYTATYTAGTSAGVVTLTARLDGGLKVLPAAAVTLTSDAFLLAANNVTVMCSAASVGDTGVVNGVTYTKRDRAGIDALVAAGDYAPLATTCTSGITDMSNVFQDQDTFNEDISSWDVSSVTNMFYMFGIARQFNQPIGSWDVSNVTNMIYMFDANEAFNQDLSDWDVSNVTTMNGMFNGAIVFNQPLGSWDVSSVTDMTRMFNFAYAFDQDISAWDVSRGPSMDSMFRLAVVFNQDLSGWCVSSITTAPSNFDTDTPAWTSARPVWGTCSPASTDASTVTASPSSLTANGTSTSTLTVQLRDAAGNNLTSSAGTLTFDTPSLGSIGVVTDNLDGTYTAAYTAGTSAGVVTLTARLDGGLKVLQTATVTLTASSPTP